MPRGPQRFNAYEQQARARKAYDFGSYLEGKGVSAEDLDTMHPEVLAKHVETAGLRGPPSAQTMEMVRGHLAYKAKLKAEPINTDDIFKNL